MLKKMKKLTDLRLKGQVEQNKAKNALDIDCNGKTKILDSCGKPTMSQIQTTGSTFKSKRGSKWSVIPYEKENYLIVEFLDVERVD